MSVRSAAARVFECLLLALFHELDPKREPEKHTDHVIEPDVEPARLHILVGVLFPAVIVAQLIFCDLLDSVYRQLGFESYAIKLALRPEKRFGSDEFIMVYVEGLDGELHCTGAKLHPLVRDRIEHLRQEPITEEELELAKNYMAGSFARSLEDPRTVARFAALTAWSANNARPIATCSGSRLARLYCS